MTGIDLGHSHLSDLADWDGIAVQDGLAIAHNYRALVCVTAKVEEELPHITIPTSAVHALGDWASSQNDAGEQVFTFVPKATLAVTKSEAIVTNLFGKTEREPLRSGDFPSWLQAVPDAEGRTTVTLNAGLLSRLAASMDPGKPVTLHLGATGEPILVTQPDAQDRFGVIMPFASDPPPLSENVAYQEALKRQSIPQNVHGI